MKYAKILGTGSYLPKKVLTNDDLSKMVDTSDEWIVSRTGMKERHIIAKGETPASMAESASREALSAAGLSPKELDLIIVSTSSPEKFFPSTACMLQGRLGANSTCAAFDLTAACTGLIYATSIAQQFIQTGRYKNILVVASECMSKIPDWTDRSTCVLFGDGAGAVIYGAGDEPGVIDVKLYADGCQKCQDLMYMDTGLYSDRKAGYVYMNGRELFKLAVKAMEQAVTEMLETHELSMDEIDWLIPHQANARIVEPVIERLGFPKDKVIWTIEKYSNTSSATIPLSLNDGIREGKIKRGQTLLLDAFAAGLTWGSALLIY